MGTINADKLKSAKSMAHDLEKAIKKMENAQAELAAACTRVAKKFDFTSPGHGSTNRDLVTNHNEIRGRIRDLIYNLEFKNPEIAEPKIEPYQQTTEF